MANRLITPEEAAPALQEAVDFMNREMAKPRGPLAQALHQVDELKQLCASCAQELDAVTQLRTGLMDTDSRRTEVQRQIQATLAHVSHRLRGVQ